MSRLILISILFYRLLGIDLEVFASGKTQSLAWDAAGRLVGLVQRDTPTNGFNWSAIYDALGRRLQTTCVPVVNGYTNTAATLTLNSYYDPQVEFEEVGLAVNGQQTWKVLGPDMDGHYGSLQGVGGLEATVRESDGFTTPVLNDCFGNVLATIAGTTTSWSPVRVGGYGPVLGYQSPTLTASTPLTDTLAWRSRGIDPSGFYCLGARYYDPMAGHFLSADPLGHAASMDLHSFCDGDPINRFDPTGRYAKSIGNNLAGGFAQFRANLGQLDLKYGDQVQETFKAIDLAAICFAVPEIAGGLLEEGLGLEAGMAYRAESEVAAWTETETAGFAETKLATSAGSTFAGEEGGMETWAASSETRLAGFSGNSRIFLPYRQGVNYSLDTVNESLGVAPTGGGSQTFNASAIRFSQSSVKNNLSQYVSTMKNQGWFGGPIDVVRMPDGQLTSVDNTRLAAAGITRTPVQAVVRDFSEPFPSYRGPEFFRNPQTRELPQTWGDAVLNRINNVTKKNEMIWRSKYPYGSPFTRIRQQTPPISP